MKKVGALVDQRGQEARELAIQREVGALITDEDIDECLERLREIRKEARTTIRAPRGKENLNDYIWIPDYPAILAAIKLTLAYKFGNPSSVVDLKLPPSQNAPPVSREQLMADLKSSGADLKDIFEAWTKVADDVKQEVLQSEQEPSVVEI